MPSTITATVCFCQLSSQATPTCMPIGSWFEKKYIEPINWDHSTDWDHEYCNSREEFITEKLCDLHHLPYIREAFVSSDVAKTAFTINDLAQLATPEEQAGIWRAMLEKFSA
mgnify:CR=1 FL=1